MNLDIALVGLFDQGLERIVAGVFTLRACQGATPGFEVRPVEGVALGSHLKEDGVEAGVLEYVQHLQELLLLLGRVQGVAAGVVDVVDGGYPGTPQFPGMRNFHRVHGLGRGGGSGGVGLYGGAVQTPSDAGDIHTLSRWSC